MRVFDCFPLFNEIDLLELRLNELWEVVDVFVIVEARQTFTGNYKPLCLPAHEERLSKYMPKIRYVVVDEFPEGMSNWGKEEYQRNALKNETSDIQPNDVVIFSDLDEIPCAKVVQSIVARGIKSGEVYCLSLAWHSFFLNIRLTKRWERQGPRLIKADDLGDFYPLRRVMAPTKGFSRNLLRQIRSSWRMGRWLRRILVPDAGWHLTWMGGIEAVALKGSSIPEHSDLPEGDKTVDWANARIKTLLNSGSGYERIAIDSSFPVFVRKNPQLFEKYMLR